MFVIGAIGAVMLCAVVWQSVFARKQVQIPLTGELSQQSPQDIIAGLKVDGVHSATLKDGNLIVAADDEARCRQVLQELSADRGTWADEWQRANEQLTPFSSASERSTAREIARARRISQVLSEMPGVQHADVVWDEETPRGFRQEAIVRATVYIRPEAGSPLTPQVVASIREAVAGSKANLAVDDVIVMDLSTGTTHHAESDAAAAIIAAELPPSPPTELPPAPTPLATSEIPSTENVQTLELLDPTGVSPSIAASPEILFQPISIDEPSNAERLAPLPAQTPYYATDAVSVEETSLETVGVARLDEPPVIVVTGASAIDRPAEPRRNRQSQSGVPATSRNWFARTSRSDLQFLAWVGIGLVILIAGLRGLLYRPRGDRLPDLSVSSHSRSTAADSETSSGTSGVPLSQPAGMSSETASERVQRPSDLSVPFHSASAVALPASVISDASRNLSDESENALDGFEHLAWLDAETIQKLYRCLPDEPWALALSGASTQIQEHVLKCLPRSSAMLLQRRMNSLPAIRLRDVEDAQRRLADWVRKLDETVESC
jgi:hypothetical protein